MMEYEFDSWFGVITLEPIPGDATHKIKTIRDVDGNIISQEKVLTHYVCVIMGGSCVICGKEYKMRSYQNYLWGHIKRFYKKVRS